MKIRITRAMQQVDEIYVTAFGQNWNIDYVTEETVCSLVYVSHACLQYN
jgi:hypothetical protein